MTGTLKVVLRTDNTEVMVSKKKFEIYDDEWDMLSALQRDYGCLPWRHDIGWSFIAIVSETNDTKMFIAEFEPNNQ